MTPTLGYISRLLRPRAFFSARVSAINEAAAFVASIGAVNEQLGDQDWIRITPYGEFPNKVGLQVVDRASGEAMVSAFNSLATKLATLWRGLPIYEGHPDDPEWRKANPGVRAVAVGRVKEMQLREDGVWGRVAFNELGTPLVRGDAPAYDAQSPHWGMTALPLRKRALRPMELNSLGLTNHPNIPGTELGLNEADPAAEQNSPVMKQYIIALLAALGRPLANAATVTDEQLAAAVNEAIPVATVLVTASNELATLKPQLTTATGQVTALNEKLTTANNRVNELSTARVDLVLTSAVNEGRITQAQRGEWAGKFNAQGADFAAVSADLGKLTKAVNTRNKVAGLGERKGEETTSTNQISAVNEAIQAKLTAVPTLKHHEALAAVKREKPELFSNDNSGAE